MELLDNFHLPKIRRHIYLVGIWPLNKGKLAPPVNHPPHPLAAMNVAHMINPPQPQIPPPMAPPPMQPPHTFGVFPNVPLSNAPASLDAPSSLPAQVASLTPEQISLMLQTLTSGQALSIPSIAPPPPQTPSHIPSQPPPVIAPQQWANPAQHLAPFPTEPLQPPPPPPPPQQQHLLSPSSMQQRQYPPQQPPYDREYRDQRGRPNHDRGGERDRGGWRGRGRGRGRGGGRDYRDDSFRKPIDSGWPRRSYNDGGGPSSPTQNRWG